MEYLDERDRTKDEDPFLIYFGFSHPHDTRDGTPELLKKYGAVNHTDKNSLPSVHPRQPQLPVNYLPEHPFDNGAIKIRDEVLAPFPRTKEVVRIHRAEYNAIMTHMDREIGRVVEQLKAMGEFENTVIMFVSDNGASAEQIIRGDRHDKSATPGAGGSYLCLGPGWSTTANTPFRYQPPQLAV